MHGRTNISVPYINANPYEQLINYTMLYDYGDEREDVTGGWSSSGYTSSQHSIVDGTKNSDHMYTVGGSSMVVSLLGTVNAVDVTPYNNLYANAEATGSNSSSSHLEIIIASSKLNINTATDWFDYRYGEKGIKNLDISNMSGNHYITSDSPPPSSRQGKTYAVWLTKSDDWSTLASKANITATSISDLLSKSSALLANKDAVQFMVAQCTGDFIASAISNSTFMTALNSSPYKTLVQSNEHWSKFLAMVA